MCTDPVLWTVFRTFNLSDQLLFNISMSSIVYVETPSTYHWSITHDLCHRCDRSYIVSFVFWNNCDSTRTLICSNNYAVDFWNVIISYNEWNIQKMSLLVTPMPVGYLVFGANKKIWAWKALLSHTITVSECYLTCHQDVEQVLCLPPIILNLLMNAFVHLYNLPFYVVFISLKTLYLSITLVLIKSNSF